MTFGTSSDGLFWMKNNERTVPKIDVVLEGLSSKDKIKALLLVGLRRTGVDTTYTRYFKHELISICLDHNINTSITVHNVTPRWLGKRKGILQILFEQRWINRNVMKPIYYDIFEAWEEG